MPLYKPQRYETNSDAVEPEEDVATVTGIVADVLHSAHRLLVGLLAVR